MSRGAWRQLGLAVEWEAPEVIAPPEPKAGRPRLVDWERYWRVMASMPAGKPMTPEQLERARREIEAAIGRPVAEVREVGCG